MGLFDQFKAAVEEISEFGKPVHAETYNPPHRPAGFSPYDAVIPIHDDTLSVSDVEDVFKENDVRYDEITGEVIDSTPEFSEPKIAFVSLSTR